MSNALERIGSKASVSGDPLADFDPASGRFGSKERAGSKEKKHKHVEPPQKKFEHEDQVFSAAFSPNSELVVTASGWERGHAIVFDVASLDEVPRVPHRDWVTTASFHPLRNDLILTASRDKFCRLWELPTEMLYGTALEQDKQRKAQAEQERREAEIGKKKLVISKKKQKELAEAAEREQLKAELKATELKSFSHTNWTVCAVFSKDGKRICSGSDSGAVQIFCVESGEQLFQIDQQEPICGSKEPICSVQFSWSGKKIVVACEDATARVYAGLQVLYKDKDKNKLA